MYTKGREMTNLYQKRNSVAIRRLSILFVVLSVLLALTATAVWAAPKPQDPVAGEGAWAEAGCKNCHGEAGEGLWAGPLAGHEKTAEEWIEQVRTPRRRMPSFSAEQISDATIILAAIDPCYCCTERMAVRDMEGRRLLGGPDLVKLSQEKTAQLKKDMGIQ